MAASKYNNFNNQTNPKAAAKPAKGPTSPAKLIFCQPCANNFGSNAPMNVICKPKYKIKQLTTEPITANGIVIVDSLASPASSTPCLKPVNAKAIPPLATADKIAAQ